MVLAGFLHFRVYAFRITGLVSPSRGSLGQRYLSPDSEEPAGFVMVMSQRVSDTRVQKSEASPERMGFYWSYTPLSLVDVHLKGRVSAVSSSCSLYTTPPGVALALLLFTCFLLSPSP